MEHFEPVINAAGKLTALGGSAQSEAVARAQFEAAQAHVDLARLRQLAGATIASLTGAEAACVTTGAAAGIAIGIAAILTGPDLRRVQLLPDVDGPNQVLLQAGHAINFGATVEQMIRIGGGRPRLFGSSNLVSLPLLNEFLAAEPVRALVYVVSHHATQENMISLGDCIIACHAANVPVLIDAAAEEDLTRYIALGADLVTYSGGKAFGGPTVGFIAGRQPLIEAAEMQFRGIARTMKVGKEAIAGLLAALQEYTNTDEHTRLAGFDAINQRIMQSLSGCQHVLATLKPDEAGRPFSRVALTAAAGAFKPAALVKFLATGTPSIRTRNHHQDQGIVLVDPRELTATEAETVAQRIREFDRSL